MLDLQEITKQVSELSQSIGKYIHGELNRLKNSQIESKGIHDFVTYVDKSAEQKIIASLSQILPEAGFIAEENQDLPQADHYNWIVDPLDGTTNFIHGVPLFSVSIALAEHDEIISGVVYEVNLQECFYAWKGGPAFLNGTPIQVSGSATVNNSLIATGFPYYDYSKLEAYLNLFKHLLQNSHGIRRLGSAAVDLAYVACGRFEAFYEYGLRPWDVAAGTLIVKQAGGKVSDFSLEKNFIFGKEIIASNGKIHDELGALVKKYFAHI